MTNHFLRVSKRGSAVKVSRNGDNAWVASIPLPQEFSDVLAQFDSTFGYPIDYTCGCLSVGKPVCSCTSSDISAFWELFSQLACDYADSLGYVSSFESLRRRFVQFYIDLPVWHEEANDMPPREFRDMLIREAALLLSRSRSTTSPGEDLPWMEWPNVKADLSEDVSAELFSSDISVLSLIRNVSNSPQSSDHPSSIASFLPELSGVEILQVGSVMDQINQVSLSADILNYFHDHEQSFLPDIAFPFLSRINNTLSKRNRMKGKFFSSQVAASGRKKIGESGGLEKFKQKLSRLLLHRKSSSAATTTTTAVVAAPALVVTTGEEKTPVEQYWEARRLPAGQVSLHATVGHDRPTSPFKASCLETVTQSIPVQTETVVQISPKRITKGTDPMRAKPVRDEGTDPVVMKLPVLGLPFPQPQPASPKRLILFPSSPTNIVDPAVVAEAVPCVPAVGVKKFNIQHTYVHVPQLPRQRGRSNRAASVEKRPAPISNRMRKSSAVDTRAVTMSPTYTEWENETRRELDRIMRE